MQKQHRNERGTHTTVIEGAGDILKVFDKEPLLKGITISPGKIEAGVGAKSKSGKFKHFNDELYEMVVTHNGSRQEFKVFSKLKADELLPALANNKKMKDWNVNYIDMRSVNKPQNPAALQSLDEKYRVN